MNISGYEAEVCTLSEEKFPVRFSLGDQKELINFSIR